MPEPICNGGANTYSQTCVFTASSSRPHPGVDWVAQVDDFLSVGGGLASQVAVLHQLDELASESKGILQEHLQQSGLSGTGRQVLLLS